MNERDFSTISPSALKLLLVRSATELPHARRAAELVLGADAVARARDELARDPVARARCRHFELRARSIDEAIADARLATIVELAAGWSLRGFAMAEARADVVYLETDLPDVIAAKRTLVAQLAGESARAGVLRLEPLDALDAPAFAAALASLPPGPVAIVHEGLLVYFDPAEKARLAANVRAALLARGGAWITADVYVRGGAPIRRDEATARFLEQHRVDENKFASFDEAAAFFTDRGFAIARRTAATADPQHLRETWTLAAR